VLVVGAAHAKVHVRGGRHAVLARADRADRLALADDRAAGDVDRAQLKERDRVAAGCGDRQGPAPVRDRAGERDRARSGGAYDPADVGADVDSAVLAAGIRVGPERERAQHRPVDGPRPPACGRGR
jgi:hypothetical protein